MTDSISHAEFCRRADDARINLLVRTVEGMDRRLRTVERLVWIAVGGVTIIAAVFPFFLFVIERALK